MKINTTECNKELKKKEMNKLKKNEEIFPPSTEQLILLYRVRRGSPADPEAILKGK